MRLTDLKPILTVENTENLPLPLRLQLPPTSKWDAVKSFFVYSETVLIARTEALVGVLTMVFAYMDYSPLLGITAFDTKQVMWLGGISFFKGLFTEFARRRHMLEETKEV